MRLPTHSMRSATSLSTSERTPNSPITVNSECETLCGSRGGRDYRVRPRPFDLVHFVRMMCKLLILRYSRSNEDARKAGGNTCITRSHPRFTGLCAILPAAPACPRLKGGNSLGSCLRFSAARNLLTHQALATPEPETANRRCVISTHDTRRNEALALRASCSKTTGPPPRSGEWVWRYDRIGDVDAHQVCA
jgi:hypothetical protein